MNIKRMYLKEGAGDTLTLYEYIPGLKAYEKDLYDVILTPYKEDVNIYFYGLSECKMLIFNLLYKAGYDGVVTTKKKDLRVKQYRYTVSGQNCYYIQVMIPGGHYLTLQNVEHVVGLEDYTQNPEDIFEAYEIMRNLSSTKEDSNRIVYSAGSVARRYAKQHSRGLYNIERWISSKTYKKAPMGAFLEKICRPAVRGGFVHWSLSCAEYRGEGIGLDCNSIYPYVCTHTDMPGRPLSMGVGKDIGEPGYYIYKVKVTGLRCTGIPCLKRDGALREDYITEVKDKKVVDRETHKVSYKPGETVLTLTETDLEVLNAEYEYESIEYLWFIRFERLKHLFDYMAPIYEHKATTTGAKRGVYKILLNSTTGSLAKKPYKETTTLKEEEGTLVLDRQYITAEDYHKQLLESSGMCYISAAIYSAARKYLLQTIKAIPEWRDRWLYSDTDSIYLKGRDIPKTVRVSDDMGAYKIEHSFSQCHFIGSKRYILDDDKEGVCLTYVGISEETKREIQAQDYSIEDIETKEMPFVVLDEEPETLSIVKRRTTRLLDPDMAPPKKEKWEPYFYQDLDRAERKSHPEDIYNRLFGGYKVDFDQALDIIAYISKYGGVSARAMMMD